MKTPSLKVIAVLLGLPLLVAVADWAWTQGQVYKYREEGAFAYYRLEETFAESLGSGGTRRAYVNISEGAEALSTGGISGPYFWLNFEVSVSRFSGSGAAYGNGPIPAQYVTFDRPANQNLTLTVDTSALGPPFFKTRYGTILVQYPSIALSWTRTGNDWYRWEGHQVRDLGNLVQHTQGSGIRYYTLPTGTITLPDIPSPIVWTYAEGWLGSQKGWNTLMQRGPGQ